MRVLLQTAFLTWVLHKQRKIFLLQKGENLVMGLSSIDSKTIKLGKEVDTSISLPVNVSGQDLLGNLFGIHWFFFCFFF